MRKTNQRRSGRLTVMLALVGLLALAASQSALTAGLNAAVGLTAQNMAFDKATVTIHFVNKDSGIPHNVGIYESSAAKVILFQGKRITGSTSIDYQFTAPSLPGTYFFRCDVHPSTMTGSFVVVPAVEVSLTARQLSFDRASITVPAGAYVTLNFSNEDAGVPHNVAIYDTAAAQTTLFQGAIITGPQTTSYTFYAPPTPGVYFFRCDVHPAMMTGDFVVVPAVTVDLTARQMAFDQSTITVPAGAYVTLHFTNSDSGIPHNVAIYDSAAAQTTLFQGTIITGPQTIDYVFFAPSAAGTYFFRCDIHPALMTGDFVVSPPGA